MSRADAFGDMSSLTRFLYDLERELDGPAGGRCGDFLTGYLMVNSFRSGYVSPGSFSRENLRNNEAIL